MKTLLDTHALLWLITGDQRLSKEAKKAFLDQENDTFFSVAGLWEICIKKSLGKLSLQPGWLEFIRNEMNSDYLAELNANGDIFYTTKLSNWTQIHSKLAP